MKRSIYDEDGSISIFSSFLIGCPQRDNSLSSVEGRKHVNREDLCIIQISVVILFR
jgi:hypothetical protein